MRRKSLRLLAVIALLGSLLAWPTPAWACTCGLQYEPPGAFAQADVVFVGTVVSVTDLTWLTKFDHLGVVSTDLYPLLYRRATFLVSESWKGVSTPHVLVRTCGYPFTYGGQYLVYAYEGNSGLETDVCTRTEMVNLATADLNFLRNLPQVPLRLPTWLPLFCAGLVGLAGVALAFTAIWHFRPHNPHRETV